MLYMIAILLKAHFNTCPPLLNNAFIILLYYLHYIHRNISLYENAYCFLCIESYGTPCS